MRLPRSTENVTAPDRRVDPFFFLMKELFRFTSSHARESEMATIFVVVLIDLSIGEESKETLVSSSSVHNMAEANDCPSSPEVLQQFSATLPRKILYHATEYACDY